MSKTGLFQTIQFSTSTEFSFLWPIDSKLSGVTTPSQSWPGNDGNKGVLRIPQSSSNYGASPLNCLMLYQGHSLGKSYPSAEMQSVYYIAPVDWTIEH